MLAMAAETYKNGHDNGNSSEKKVTWLLTQSNNLLGFSVKILHELMRRVCFLFVSLSFFFFFFF